MPGREPVMPNDQPPAMRLPTGEWISFRGKFAEAEPAARSIVEEAQEQLTLIARDAREGGWDAVVKRRFTVTGPTLKS